MITPVEQKGSLAVGAGHQGNSGRDTLFRQAYREVGYPILILGEDV